MSDVKWKRTGPYDTGDLVLGLDMQQYEIVKVESTHAELPQLCRYTVNRLERGVVTKTIENYPHYLLGTHLGRVVRKGQRDGR